MANSCQKEREQSAALFILSLSVSGENRSALPPRKAINESARIPIMMYCVFIAQSAPRKVTNEISARIMKVITGKNGWNTGNVLTSASVKPST